MGNDISAEQRESFENKLQFVQVFQDEHLGPIDIFRFKQAPFEYIMDHQKTFVEGDPRPWDKYLEQLKKLQETEHKNLAKIHVVDAKKQNHMCIKGTKIHTFCTYYNFTLRQAIDKKKARETRFTESQLIYILSCLLDIACELKKRQISFGDYRSDRIFISPEGYIKVYLLEVDSENGHRAYYKALTEKSKIGELVLSPQQLSGIYRLQSEPGIDIYKADLFAIGMIIMELITLDNLKFYYNEQKSGLKMGRIYFDISSYYSEYSPQFLDLVRAFLEEEPQHRMQLQKASSFLEQIKKRSSSVSYCIRLNDDQQSKKKKSAMSVKSQYILTGIEKRLTPSPIQTLASSTSSGFQSKNSGYRGEDVSRIRK